MSSFYDDASLVMIPSCYKTSTVLCEKPTDGSGDLTFTRTGDTATRVNSSGLVEKVRTNLTLYSQDLTNAAYISGGTGSVVRTGNYAAAPDGTNTATRIQITRGATYQELYQRITGLTVGDEYTLSFYAKSLSGTPTLSTAFNNGYANEVTFTSSWVRYTYTFIVAPTGRAGLNLLTLGGGTSTTADILIWGVQLESGVATAYIPTTTAAVSVGPVANLARLDYLNSSCPRLLLEPQRTNLVFFSEQLNNAGWAASAVVTANTAVSPDGYTNADSVMEVGINEYQILGDPVTTVSGTAYTFSFFAKPNGRNFARILFGNGSFPNNQSAYFNLLTGATSATASVTASMVSYGNGWYRCIATCTSDANATDAAYFGPARNMTDGYATYVGNASVGIYAWGVQQEAGAYATSYIPTLGAAVTRGADACSKTGISSLIGQSEGVVFVDFEVTDPANFQSINVYNNNKAGNTISTVTIQFNLTQVIASIFYGNGTFDTITLNATGYGLNQRLKVAFRYKSGDLALYINGVQKDTDATTYTAIGTKSEVFLGDPTVYFAYKGGLKINNYLQFTSALTNAQLAELTTL